LRDLIEKKDEAFLEILKMCIPPEDAGERRRGFHFLKEHYKFGTSNGTNLFNGKKA